MAENTQIISGYIVRPNGDPFTEGVVRFTLGRSDTDEDEVIAAGKYVEFEIATDGSFAAELWPNTRGNVGGAYIVQVREAERTPFETIGRVQVQDDGPYDLAALLRADIPQAQNTFYSVLSQDEYDAFIAEMDAKVAEAQGYAESYDVAAISAAVTATGEDAVATAADRVATGEDATATAADRVATGEDATATAADRVATGEDVIAAGNSAQAASDAAAAVPDIKTFDTYVESVTYGKSNSEALIFCKDPAVFLRGSVVFWKVDANFHTEYLFLNGETGAWYAPGDLSTLWQDTAGTVPVTADAQSVARMDDKSGNDNHSTQSGSSFRPKYDANGLSYDGLDDRMTTSLTPTVSGTIIARFNGDTTTDSRIIMGSALSGSGRCFLAMSGSGRLAAGIGLNGTSVIFGGPDIRGEDHVGAVTWDGSTVKLYLDGVEVYSAAQSGAVNTTVPILEGALNLDGLVGAFWDGTISDAVPIDRALTPEEILNTVTKWNA